MDLTEIRVILVLSKILFQPCMQSQKKKIEAGVHVLAENLDRKKSCGQAIQWQDILNYIIKILWPHTEITKAPQLYGSENCTMALVAWSFRRKDKMARTSHHS